MKLLVTYTFNDEKRASEDLPAFFSYMKLSCDFWINRKDPQMGLWNSTYVTDERYVVPVRGYL